MKFLYPQFLWALTALIIPVIIHLFNFQRPRKVFFSNVSLLENVKTRTSSVQNLKHFLILLSRMLFLAMLVLAFAQPFLPASEEVQKDGKTARVFYLDNSFSMQQQSEGLSMLENAVSGLDAFQEMIGNNEDVFFLDNDFRVKDLFPYTKSNFSDRLAEINESYSSRSLKEMLQRIDQIEHKGPKEIFLISDFQKSSLDISEGIGLDSANTYHFIPLSADEISNISIDSAWLEKPFVFRQNDNNLYVKLRYEGGDNLENFPVTLFIDSRQAAASSVNLGPEGSSEIVFTIPFSEQSESRGIIRIDDSPVYFDNEYFFVLKSVEELEITVLGSAENKYLKALYNTEKFFSYNYMDISNPDYNLLKASDFIILDKIERYPEYLVNFLNSYFEKGGYVLVIPGQKIEELQAFLSRPGYPSVRSLNSVQSIAIDDPDLDNPFFAGVFERFEKNTDMPYAKPVIEINGLDLIHLKYKDGTTFLGEKGISQGKIFILSSDLKESESNFYRHSIFVPVMYKMSTSVFEGSAERLAYSFGDKSVLWEMSRTNLGESALSLRKEDFEIIPEQRPGPEGVTLDLPEDRLEPGFYEVLMRDSVLGTIAINVNSEESRLESHSREDLVRLLPQTENVEISVEAEMKDFAGEYKESHFGTPLWKYFLICSIIFLATEVFLLRLL